MRMQGEGRMCFFLNGTLPSPSVFMLQAVTECHSQQECVAWGWVVLYRLVWVLCANPKAKWEYIQRYTRTIKQSRSIWSTFHTWSHYKCRTQKHLRHPFHLKWAWNLYFYLLYFDVHIAHNRSSGPMYTSVWLSIHCVYAMCAWVCVCVFVCVRGGQGWLAVTHPSGLRAAKAC